MVPRRKPCLVVDDDPDFLVSLRDFMRANLHDLDVDTRESTKAAMELVASRPYDMVMADLRMPSMDGVEFLRQVKAARPTARLILFTADPSVVRDRPDAAEVADLVLLKPLQTEPFLGRLRKILAGR